MIMHREGHRLITSEKYPDRREPLPGCVSRALRAMRMALARPFDVAGLARVAGASPRTLQRCFRERLGKPPVAVLNDLRYEHARRILLRGAAATTVAEAALRSGLLHLGRFSAEYARRYGEKPSQTLRRRRHLAAETLPSTPIILVSEYEGAIAIDPVQGNERQKDLAAAVTDELSSALLRSGIALTAKPEHSRYRLQVGLRGDAPDFRVISRLVETATGRHLWAHQHEAINADEVVEDAPAALAGALQTGLRAVEVQHAQRKTHADSTIRDLALRAVPYAVAFDAESNSRALDLLERAIERDSEHSLSIALASWCYAQRVIYHFTDTPMPHRVRANALTERVTGRAADATALAVLGNTFALLGKMDVADRVTRKALDACGSSSWAWARSGLIDVCNAQPASGIERLQIALELAPDDPLKFNHFIGLGVAHFGERRFAHAAYWFERAVFERPAAVWAHELLCPAYMKSGRKAEATASLAALRHQHPDMTIGRVVGSLSFFTPNFCELIADGLEAAGLKG
jgi:AraC-like DNA-binding protein